MKQKTKMLCFETDYRLQYVNVYDITWVWNEFGLVTIYAVLMGNTVHTPKYRNSLNHVIYCKKVQRLISMTTNHWPKWLYCNNMSLFRDWHLFWVTIDCQSPHVLVSLSFTLYTKYKENLSPNKISNFLCYYNIGPGPVFNLLYGTLFYLMHTKYTGVGFQQTFHSKNISHKIDNKKYIIFYNLIYIYFDCFSYCNQNPVLPIVLR